MSDLAITGLLVLSLFLILGSGVWIGLTLSGVAWIGMQLFSSRPAGDAMAVTIWGSASSWTLTALPLFIWMGEILFRTRLSQDMFKGLAPWVQALPGRLLHTNVVGCTIFAAVSGSSAATCATIGKMTLPELTRRGYPEHMVVGTLAGAEIADAGGRIARTGRHGDNEQDQDRSADKADDGRYGTHPCDLLVGRIVWPVFTARYLKAALSLTVNSSAIGPECGGFPGFFVMLPDGNGGAARTPPARDQLRSGDQAGSEA